MIVTFRIIHIQTLNLGFPKIQEPNIVFFPLIKSSDLDDFGVLGYASISDSSNNTTTSGASAQPR